MGDSGYSEKKRRYFVDNDAYNAYSGSTIKEVLDTLRAELESIDFTDDEQYDFTITSKMMTDEEVENLPDI